MDGLYEEEKFLSLFSLRGRGEERGKDRRTIDSHSRIKFRMIGII